MYGCERLRELVSVICAHSKKTYHLGFGKEEIKLANLAKANANRDYRIFEEFAKKLIEIAQNKRINAPFDLNGKFYAFDSTTIDLCLSLFWWAKFRSTKSGGDEQKLDYINVPILFQYMFDNGFRLQAGPQLGLLVRADNKDDLNPIDLGVGIGVSYVVPSTGFGVDARCFNLRCSCSIFSRVSVLEVIDCFLTTLLQDREARRINKVNR